jgi:TetR/AcrR family transcriptional repressor of nem operon
MVDQITQNDVRESILSVAETLILENSYTGVSISDIVRESGLTERAVTSQFPDMEDIAQNVLERYARNDMALFEDLSDQASAQTDDPLEHVIVFIQLFSDFLDDLAHPFPGCIFASYVYSRRHFGPETHDFIDQSLDGWCGLYEKKFANLMNERKPKVPVTPRALAEMITTIIEGGIVMANAKKDARWTQRQSEQFQNYLRVLFD